MDTNNYINMEMIINTLETIIIFKELKVFHISNILYWYKFKIFVNLWINYISLFNHDILYLLIRAISNAEVIQSF